MTIALYYSLIGMTFLIAGMVKGTIGLGLPTVAMALLGVWLPPSQAAALLLIPSLVTNLWQLFNGPAWVCLLRRLWPMLAAVCLGTVFGPNLMAGGRAGWASLALGLLLMLYALLGLANLRWRVNQQSEAWLGPVIGLATGAITGATGVFVIPAVPYLTALSLDRDELIQALGLSFTLSTLALAAGLARHHLIDAQMVGLSLLAVAPALAGMLFGTWLRGKISAALFRRALFVGLLGLGLEITWRHLPMVW